MNDYAIGAAPAKRMRAGGAVLAALWVLLIAVYTLPLWLPGYISWDFSISVVPPARTWMVVALGIILLLLPPLPWPWPPGAGCAASRAPDAALRPDPQKEWPHAETQRRGESNRRGAVP